MFGATKVTTGKFIVFKRFILFKNKTFKNKTFNYLTGVCSLTFNYRANCQKPTQIKGYRINLNFNSAKYINYKR